MIKVSELKLNDSNPRKITKAKLKKLRDDIKNQKGRFLKSFPIVIDEHNIVISGNQRLKSLISLGYEELEDDWVVKESNLTEEQRRYIIINGNTHEGEWEESEDWSRDELVNWGVMDQLKKDDPIEGKVKFSEFIGEENNYIVLKFNNDVDWLQAKTHFDLKTVSSKRANGKEWIKGVGRVVDGAEYLKKLKK